MLTLVLLAGGSSSRFKPLSEKNLYTFLGKSLVRIQLERTTALKADKLIIISNDENFETIKSEVDSLKLDAEVRKQAGEGQAGAVTTAIDGAPDDSEVLIINMNDVFEDKLMTEFNNLRPELAKNQEHMLTGFKTETYFPGGYLVLEGDFIKKVVEKPGAGNEPSEFVRIVFDYFSTAKALRTEMEKASSSKDDVYETALSNMMQSQKFRMLRYDGIWRTIKYPWHILAVMEYFLGTIEGQQIADDAKIAESARINGNVIIESGVKIFDNAVINGPVYLGKNCIVGNNALVRDSMLGEGCVVGFASEVARSYFKNQVWLHMNYIGDTIIEENVSFGSTAHTANFRLDEGNIKVNVKGEKIDSGLTKLGAIIGSKVRIGTAVSIMPGIKIGNDSFVGSGLVVDEDVEAGKFIYLKQDKQIKDNKIDISKSSREHLKKKL